jgi:hypothetical protein
MMSGVNAGEACADDQDVEIFRGSGQSCSRCRGPVDGMNITQGKPLPAAFDLKIKRNRLDIGSFL